VQLVYNCLSTIAPSRIESERAFSAANKIRFSFNDNIIQCLCFVGRDSSVGIATRYGLHGPGIESRCGRDFSHSFRPALGPTQSLLYNGYRVSFPGVKRPGRGVDHRPSYSARVKERVGLYLYSPSGPSWPVLGRTLPCLCFVRAHFVRTDSVDA
jgi:hypothetical protein